MIGTAFAMHVNAHRSNYDPNHEADHDPKRLSERDSFFCEHSQCIDGSYFAISFDKSAPATEKVYPAGTHLSIYLSIYLYI